MWFKRRTPALGDFEQLVLLGVMRLERDGASYGAAIRQEIHARSGRDVSINAVYTTLDRLEGKGFLDSWVGEPTPERGGRRRKFYRLRPAGLLALRQAYRALTAMASSGAWKPNRDPPTPTGRPAADPAGVRRVARVRRRRSRRGVRCRPPGPLRCEPRFRRLSLAPAAVGPIHALDPEQPVQNIRTMEEVRDRTLGAQRFTSSLFGLFAGLALLLASVGIYSVLSYIVRGRSREMGIRAALGAQAGDIVRLVIVEGMTPTLGGLALGIAAAYGAPGSSTGWSWA